MGTVQTRPRKPRDAAEVATGFETVPAFGSTRGEAAEGLERHTSIIDDVEVGEELISLAELSSQPFVPKRKGKKPHFSLWFRWAAKGLRGVKLETLRTGGRLCSTRGAVLRFYTQLTSGSGSPPNTSARTKHFRRQVDSALDEAGIG